MQKKIGAFEARRNFGKVLQGVAANGDHVIVERHGEAIAAVVPMHLYVKMVRRRQELGEMIETMRSTASMSPEEADELAREAVQAVRRGEA